MLYETNAENHQMTLNQTRNVGVVIKVLGNTALQNVIEQQ